MGAEPSERTQTPGRVDGIDLLRGIAIVFVLCNHVNMRLLGAHIRYLSRMPAWLAPIVAWNGQSAVQMFFVLSGYLITATSMRRWGAPGQLGVRQFYALRFARIAPLLVSVVVLLSMLHLLGVHGFVVHSATGGLPRAVVAALLFHINYLEATRDYLPGGWDILWSLSVEEVFYLAFPLVARGLKTRWLLTVALLALVAAGPFARMPRFNPNPVWREYSYLGGMDAIALGCLAAMWTSERSFSPGVRRAAGWAGSALIVFVFCFADFASRIGLADLGLTFTVLAIGVALVVIAAVSSGWRAPRILAPLLVLGQRSYEVYLTHMFALLAVFGIFTKLGSPMRGVPVLFLATVCSAGVLGWWVGAFFAEPVNRALRARTAGWFARGRAAV
jgi:peptidoglycan/LPS O-acetylase OafA/YrhL